MVAALIMLMMPAQRRNETRAVALASATFALILSVWVYFSYDQTVAGYQFVETGILDLKHYLDSKYVIFRLLVSLVDHCDYIPAHFRDWL